MERKEGVAFELDLEDNRIADGEGIPDGGTAWWADRVKFMFL